LPRSRRPEIRRTRAPGDISVAEFINRDCVGEIAEASANIGRIDQHRIDNQCLPPVVRADAKAGFFTVQKPRPGDLNPFTRDLLIDDRFLVPVFILTQPDDEVTLFVDSHSLGAVECEPDLFWISARRYNPVVFQASVVSVVDKIDSGIETTVAGSRIVRNGTVPLARVAANEIVG